MNASKLSEQESFEFLGSLFPGGLKDPAVITELCPEGWGESPLVVCYHPAPEVRYVESLEFSRNMKNLSSLLGRRKGEAAQTLPEEPEPTFEEFLAKNPPGDTPISAVEAIEEPAELLGLCLWDIFSDNHDVAGHVLLSQHRIDRLAQLRWSGSHRQNDDAEIGH
jgi:hypothetical protein